MNTAVVTSSSPGTVRATATLTYAAASYLIFLATFSVSSHSSPV